MKQQSVLTFFSLSALTMPNNNEIDETLKEGFNTPQQKVFSSVDLWNIQRRRRGMVQRRFSF